MPCNSDYMAPHQPEINLSKVLCFIDEVKTGKLDKSSLGGYHKGAYGKFTKEKLDKATAELCSMLKNKDTTRYSLELQIWWRDHQEADRQRVFKEASDAKARAVKEQALKKLTPEERKALGL